MNPPPPRIHPFEPHEPRPAATEQLVLYVTFDGLLQPLGRSQVVRYLERLSDRGWQFCILSLERAQDLADSERVAALEAKLGEPPERQQSSFGINGMIARALCTFTSNRRATPRRRALSER